MKRSLAICMALLSLPLLAGCAVISPADPELREGWDETAGEAREGFWEDLRDPARFAE